MSAIINIRAYKPYDKDSCISVFKSNMPRYFALSELSEFKQWLDNYREHEGFDIPTEVYFVLEVNKSVVGCGGYHINKKNKIVTLTWGMIELGLHKQGLGERLFKYRIKVITKVCVDYVIILDTSQYSFSFFKKMGFCVSNIKKDFYGIGLDRYDMIFQKK